MLVNRSADDQDFVSRLFILYFPAGLKVFAVIVLLIIATAVLSVESAFPRTSRDITELKTYFVYFLYITVPFMTWLFFFILYRSFKRLAGLIVEGNKAPNDALQSTAEKTVNGVY
ncbi:MAG TPA: hypothetical protein VMT62_01040 [Syntrophorhabdaceae bacterium]|nr:hypothetical protein [Syntrophorhabdaceae bacterium]